MTATVSKTTLRAALLASLDNATTEVIEAHSDFDLMLSAAAERLARSIRRRRRASLTLVANQGEYDLPDDCLAVDYSTWATYDRVRQPWEETTGPMPTVSTVDGDDDTKVLVFSPAPTQAQLSRYGADYAYTYSARHVLTDAESSIPEDKQSLFLLMAQVEALLFIARRNAAKPVSMNDGYTGTPRNGTPAALAEQLNDQVKGWLEEHRRILA